MRALGSNALLHTAFESTLGVAPASGATWFRQPFVSSNIGEEQGLIESDLLGLGRESSDPTPDVINNVGDLVVPVDLDNFGRWLKLAMGDAADSNSGFASGSIAFSGQPAVNATITINGTAFTFVASGATGNQINIGANIAATIGNAVTALNASVVAGVALATYAAASPNLTITFDTAGLAGNAFTLAASTSPASNGTVSGGTLTGGTVAHLFTSGALALPSMSIEVGHPDIGVFTNNYGARLNQMRIALARSGLLNATLGLICIGESDPVGATIAGGSPAVLAASRFAQATGSVKKDGVELASVVSAELTLSNSLDTVETIKADGRIEDADPGMFTFSGSVTIRYKDSAFQTLARNRTPFDLSFGWNFGAASLLFDAPRIFLPRTKRPVTGPKGIQQTFNFQGSGASGHTLTATLKNTTASY